MNARKPHSEFTAACPLGSKAGVATPPRSASATPRPNCKVCGRREITSCICNMPDPEPEYFKPGGNYDPDAGWAFAERSAFGMPGVKA